MPISPLTPQADVPRSFLAQGPFTAPRDLAGRLQRLAARGRGDPAALAEVVRSVVVHVFWRGAYGAPEDPARAQRETNLRDVRSMLARIGELQASVGRDPDDVSPLPPEARLIGNCRDHSVLYAALLRTAGVPARARCGFARYFEKGKWIDHWVVERWEAAAGRWIITDAQLDALMREKLQLAFDPMDMPDGEFRCGGEAWLACRAGDDPGLYGIFEWNGWDFVKGNLVRDASALAGRELAPWDCWGLILQAREGMDEAALARVDEIARATPMRVRMSRTAAERLAGQPGLALPDRVQAYVGPKPVDVDLRQVLHG